MPISDEIIGSVESTSTREKRLIYSGLYIEAN